MAERVGRYVSVASRYMASYISRRLEPLQMGPGQYMYLFALYREDGQSQQHLSDRLHVDKSATVGAINKLEAAGYVERRAVESDKRCYRIFLTPAGKALKPRLEEIMTDVQAQLTRGMSDEEQETLVQLMRRVTDNIIHAVRADGEQ